MATNLEIILAEAAKRSKKVQEELAHTAQELQEEKSASFTPRTE